MTCQRYQSWMVEAVYGELDDARRGEFETHLEECAECAPLFAELQGTAGLMHRRQRPEPGPEFWGGYWQRLQARAAREEALVVDSSRPARRRSLGSWGYRVAAAVAVLAAGVWLGRTVLSPSPPPVATQVATTETRADSALGTPRDAGRSHQTEPTDEPSHTAPPELAPELAEDTRDTKTTESRAPIDTPSGETRGAPREEPADANVVLASQDDEARRYIERSQFLLLAVLNGDADDEPSFGAQRERAGALVREASSVRESSNDRRMRELVTQLEMILREIAHLEEDADVEAVDVIRNRVDREGVLLRINLEQMRAANTTPAPGPID